MSHAIVILLFSFFVYQGTCSECVYRSYHGDNYLEALCYNISPDMVLDIDPDNMALIQKVTIAKNSSLHILPSSSSLALLRNLKSLVLSDLEIEEISPRAFEGLDLGELDLAANRLKEIPPGVFDGLKKLAILDLSFNFLSKVEENYFKNVKSLRTLILGHNRISHIDDDSFSGLLHLEILILEENKITVLQESLFKNLPNLHILRLGSNPLENFNVNLSQHNVSFVDLSEGNLKEFDFSSLNLVRNVINLTSNQISKIENLNSQCDVDVFVQDGPQFLINYVDVFLGNNKIKHLDQPSVASNSHVHRLDLSNNEIESASCLGVEILEELVLSNNKISAIKKGNFKFCKNLSILDLSYNQIVNLDADAFEEADSLGKLLLSNNNLKEINPDVFSGLKHLYSLTLHENKIVSFDADKFIEKVSGLRVFSIFGNMLSCDDLMKIVNSFKAQHVQLLNDYDSNRTCRV